MYVELDILCYTNVFFLLLKMSDLHTIQLSQWGKIIILAIQSLYFQLEKFPQSEHVKTSVVAAFLSMFKDVNLWPFTFQGHQIKFFRCENIT